MQVRECILLAKQGKPYKLPVPTQPPAVGLQARPNLAFEEARKASPDGKRGSGAATRKLKEGLQDSGSQLLEGKYKAIAVLSKSVLRNPPLMLQVLVLQHLVAVEVKLR